MACYHPLFAIRDAHELSKNGKPLLHIVGSKRPNVLEADAVVQLPCGQCLGCRLDYAREWADRLLMELQYHDQSNCYFVTLTYDPAHIDHLLSDQGFASLCKKDLQDFMKRLRRKVNLCYHYDDDGQPILYQRGLNKGLPKLFYDETKNKVRFYACGEYGSEDKTHRPHFHLILFDGYLDKELPDGSIYGMDFLKRSGLGYNYYSSELLRELWPFGYNVVANVTWESCCYTARYMMKKLKGGDADVYFERGLTPPFSLCSRKPGLAQPFYEDHRDFTEVSYYTLGSSDGSRTVYPPSYFTRLLEKDNPIAAEEYKAVKKFFAEERWRIELLDTDLDELEYLSNQEKSLEKKITSLYNFRKLDATVQQK